jgi:hypothetical protein
MRNALDAFKHNEHEHREGKTKKSFVSRIVSRENLWAFVLFLIVAALIIFTSDSSPVWIYQGF